MRGVKMVGVGGVRVMRGLFVRAGVVMFRRLLVMTCRVFVMFRRFPVMVCRFLRHEASFGVKVRESCVYGSTNRTSVPISMLARLLPSCREP